MANAKLSKKKTLIITFAVLGTAALSAAVVAGIVEANKQTSSNSLNKTLYENTTTASSISLSKKLGTSSALNLSANGNILDNISPVSIFQTLLPNGQNQTLSNEIISGFNNLSIPWLNINNANGAKLQIVNYYLASGMTFTSNNIAVAAIQVQNPIQNSVYISYKNGNTTSKFLLPYNAKAWIYVTNNTINYTMNNTLPNNVIANGFSNNDVLLNVSINSNYTYNQKENKYIAPTIPPQSPLQIAQTLLDENGQTILREDLYNMILGLNAKKDLKVNYDGEVVSIDVIQPFQLSPSDIVFTPATINSEGVVSNPASVTIKNLTGGLSVYVPSIKSTLNLQVKVSNETIPVKPLLMWTNSDTKKTQTQPAVSSNTLAGMTFQNSNEQLPPASKLRFGYYLGKGLLGLYQNGKEFNLQQISFSYLFYNFWMINHPTKPTWTYPASDAKYTFDTTNTYGSVYDNGNSSLVAKSTPIPKNYVQGWTGADNENVFSSNLVINQSIPFIEKNLTEKTMQQLYDGKVSAINYTITEQSYPSLYQIIVNSNPWLKSLNANLAYQFVVTLSMKDGHLIMNVTQFQVYNKWDVSNISTVEYRNKAFVYFLSLNHGSTKQPDINTYIVYPIKANIPSTQIGLYTTNIPINIPIYIQPKSIPNLKSIPGNLALPIPSSFANQYYDATMFMNEIANPEDALSTAMLQEWTNDFEKITDNKNFSFTKLNYQLSSDSQNVNITGFLMQNNSSSYQNIQIGSTTYQFAPFQSIAIKNIGFIVTGLTPTFNAPSSIDIATTPYANLLTTNFVSDTSFPSDQTIELKICQALSTMLIPKNDINNLSIVGYSSNANNKLETSLNITGLTFDNKASVPYRISIDNQQYLLKPNTKTTLNITKTPITLNNFQEQLAPSRSSIIDHYMDQCQNWLSSLTQSEVQNDFVQIGKITHLNSNMPSPTSLNYSNYSVDISNYDPKTCVATLSKMTWNVSGTAETGVSILPTVSISVTLDQTASVPIKLVPMIFYDSLDQSNPGVQSYPQVEVTASDLQDIDGISKYVAVKTELNYKNIPNPSMMKNIRYGYYLEPVNSDNANQYAGSGLSLKLGGADAEYKPYLNISYVMYNSVMNNHFVNNEPLQISAKNPAPYGSYSSPTNVAAYVPKTSSINPYGAVDLTVSNQVSLLNDEEMKKLSYIDFYNNLYEQKYTSNASSALDLPSDIKIDKLVFSSLNQIQGFEYTNNSHTTYKLNIDIDGTTNSYFLLPMTTDGNISFALNSSININNTADLNYDQTVDLYNYNSNTAYKAYYNDATTSAYYSYLYPLLGDVPYSDLVAYHFNFWHPSQSYSYIGKTGENNPYLVNTKSWTQYISVIYKHNTFTMQMVQNLLGLNSSLGLLLQAYKIYAMKNVSNQLYISSIELNGTWLNTNITINGGKVFYLS